MTRILSVILLILSAFKGLRPALFRIHQTPSFSYLCLCMNKYADLTAPNAQRHWFLEGEYFFLPANLGAAKGNVRCVGMCLGLIPDLLGSGSPLNMSEQRENRENSRERKGKELAELNDGPKRREWGLQQRDLFTKSF